MSTCCTCSRRGVPGDSLLSLLAWAAVAAALVTVVLAPLAGSPDRAPLHRPTPAHTVVVPTPEAQR